MPRFCEWSLPFSLSPSSSQVVTPSISLVTDGFESHWFSRCLCQMNFQSAVFSPKFNIRTSFRMVRLLISVSQGVKSNFRNFISAVSFLLLSAILSAQFSHPCNRTGAAITLYNFNCVSFLVLLLRIRFMFLKNAEI
jgi:hypothetical protein